MPFKKVAVDLGAKPSLDPLGNFDPDTTFGQRLQAEQEGKQRVAWYVVDEWFNGRPDAFILDGSSTFYVGLAAALNPNLKQTDIYSNNLGISTELDSRPRIKDFKLELAGGRKDFDLNATLGTEAKRCVRQFLDETRLVIASVRQLDAEDGPTAPERGSRSLKKLAMTCAGQLIVVMDWTKLATPPIAKCDLVFNHRPFRDEIQLQDILYVCSPPGDMGDTQKIGHALRGRSLNPAAVLALSSEEKYALNAFDLSMQEGATFVEVREP